MLRPMSTLASYNPVLGSLIQELVGPLILIDNAREVAFRSRAFDRIVGCDLHASCHCDALLLPARTEAAEACCWDALDLYLDKGGSALWPVLSVGGNVIPMLCHIYPLDMAGNRLYIALQFEPLNGAISAAAFAFFSAQRHAMDEMAYAIWLTKYIARHFQTKHVAWLSDDALWEDRVEFRDHFRELIRERIQKCGRPMPFDLILKASDRPCLYHVFPLSNDNSPQEALIFTASAGPLDASCINEIYQAVMLRKFAIGADKETAVGADLLIFTAREQQILALVSKGLTDKAIAKKLNLSIHTIKNRMRLMMRKAQVNKRAALMSFLRPSE